MHGKRRWNGRHHIKTGNRESRLRQSQVSINKITAMIKKGEIIPPSRKKYTKGLQDIAVEMAMVVNKKCNIIDINEVCAGV